MDLLRLLQSRRLWLLLIVAVGLAGKEFVGVVIFVRRLLNGLRIGSSLLEWRQQFVVGRLLEILLDLMHHLIELGALLVGQRLRRLVMMPIAGHVGLGTGRLLDRRHLLGARSDRARLDVQRGDQ